MPRRTPYLLVLILAPVALAASGCLGLPDPEPEPARPAATTAAPSPTATPAKDDLVAALGKLNAAQFTYHVQSNLPEVTDGRIDVTGGYDRAGQVYEESVTLTGSTHDGTSHRIVFGNDSYSRTKETDKWIHLDLARLQSSRSMLGINMADPTGLAVFITTITEATRSGPHSYKGRFDPLNHDDFLPVGHPSLVAFYTSTAPFTAETDEQGNVTTIHVELELKDKPTVIMNTTFAGHGQPLGTQRPAKKNTAEADPMYYK